jgi:hypothetical protein
MARPSNQMLALLNSWAVGLKADSDALDRGVSRAEAIMIQERAIDALRFWSLHMPGVGFEDTLREVEDFLEMWHRARVKAQLRLVKGAPQ